MGATAPMPEATTPAPDGGAGHLRRIGRLQWGLWAAGSAAWALRGRDAVLVFAVGGLASMLYWHLHRVIVVRMLSPLVRRRWFYGFLALMKLTLIVLVLHGMMSYFPLEVLPLVTGILLFNASIMLEAAWLVLRPEV